MEKNIRLGLRIDAQTKEVLTAAAKEAGLSLNEYIARLLYSHAQDLQEPNTRRQELEKIVSAYL